MSRVDVLFVHNNFPAQFRNLARTFSASPDICVRAIGAGPAPGLAGVDLQRYDLTARSPQAVHAFARRFERESRRAEQVIYAANSLRLSGFEPKLIYVHPGWGEALPLRSLFPDATICCYAEFYYWPFGADVGFDKEFPSLGVDGEVRVSLWNAATLLALVDADFAIAPTAWQRSVFPKELRPKIHVVHDGFDLGALQGRPPRRLSVGDHDFAPGDEIVTFVARNLEPYRGFHIFMRALPRLLAARPKARICIVGGDQVSYGSAPVGHPNWRTALVEEMRASLDLSRVHFLGTLPYDRYLDLLRLSSAHVYLTYPFVLSWSMLEAMALGCLIIGSDTPPVSEVVTDGVNGRLVPFFEPDRLADTIAETLGDPSRFAPLRAEAARSAATYDFAATIWPKHVALLEEHLMSRALLDTIRSLKPSQTAAPPG